MSFACSKCGLCCKNPVIAQTCPELDRGDGICIYLMDDNTCAIYDSRPDYCRLDVLYENSYADKMTKDEFYKWYSKNVCAVLETHGKELEKQRQLYKWSNMVYDGEITIEDVPTEFRKEVERYVINRKEFNKWVR